MRGLTLWSILAFVCMVAACESDAMLTVPAEADEFRSLERALSATYKISLGDLRTEIWQIFQGNQSPESMCYDQNASDEAIRVSESAAVALLASVKDPATKDVALDVIAAMAAGAAIPVLATTSDASGNKHQELVVAIADNIGQFVDLQLHPNLADRFIAFDVGPVADYPCGFGNPVYECTVRQGQEGSCPNGYRCHCSVSTGQYCGGCPADSCSSGCNCSMPGWTDAALDCGPIWGQSFWTEPTDIGTLSVWKSIF